MTVPFRCLGLLIAAGLVGACALGVTRSSPEPMAQAGDYEIYNPTSCEAVAWTTDSTGRVHRTLARIPSGERTVVRVPALPQGSRIQAHATAPDGSDCQRGNYQILIRRLES
jgi:hypothetical protein